MKKWIKWTLIILFSLVAFLIVAILLIAYYIAGPLVDIRNAELGDEMIQTGDFVYALPKDSYEKGDIILVNACEPEIFKKTGVCRSNGQATRKVVALPGETVPIDREMVREAMKARSEMPEGEREKIGIIVSTTIPERNGDDAVYGIGMPVSGRDLISIREGIIPKSMVYGVVEKIPSKGWGEAWEYFVIRTKHLPDFFRWLWNGGFEQWLEQKRG